MDQFVLSTSSDRIVLFNNDACVLMLAGAMTIQDYNTLIGGVQFYRNHRAGGDLKAAYVYWTHQFGREYILDFSTMHVYSTVKGNSRWTPLTSYPNTPAPEICALSGMYVADFGSQLRSEMTAARQSRNPAVQGESTVGATRANAIAPWVWSSSAIPLNSTSIQNYPTQPQYTSGVYCSSLAQYNNGIKSIPCSQNSPSTLCEANSMPTVGTTMHTLTPIPIDYEVTRIYDLSTTKLYPFKPSVDMAHIDNETTWYGMTMQLAI